MNETTRGPNGPQEIVEVRTPSTYVIPTSGGIFISNKVCGGKAFARQTAISTADDGHLDLDAKKKARDPDPFQRVKRVSWGYMVWPKK